MDITIDVGKEYILNVRAGGIIIHKNKVLTHKDVKYDHCCIPGGRIGIGENSKETIKREIQEELGKEIEVEKYLTTIENFFEMNGKKYHEIMFVYKIEFKNDEDKKIVEDLKNQEGKEYLKYEWKDINKLDECNLQPKCFRKLLKNKEWTRNVINID